MSRIEVRYRRKWWGFGPLRAQISDGSNWLWLDRIGTEWQIRADAAFSRNEALLAALDKRNKPFIEYNAFLGIFE